MNKKQIALAVVLADFSALTAYAVMHYGVVGLFEAAFANAATITVFADLTIALSMVIAWMWQDARQHGVSPIPYVVLTLGFGSVGPLLYLIRRLGRDAVAAPQSVLQPRPHAARA
jgi:MFS superfamily sulfate permease-like transporter